MHEPPIGAFRTQDARPDELRIGDAERDEVMAALREHFAQGRLTSEELDERLERTLAARTGRDLREITKDLPDLSPAPARAGARDRHPWQHGHGHAHGHGHGHGHLGWHGWSPPPPVPWGHAHKGAMGRHAPWGPPSRHGHHLRHHPPFPLVLLGVLAIVSVVAGTAWPLLFALKAMVVGAIVFAVVRLARHRRRG